MPGGHLSFAIYQRLGGEREFGAFWLQLGLPTVAVLAVCYLLLSQRTWMIVSAGLIAAMAVAVNARMLS